MKKKNGYWNYETCMEESKKYKSRSEFCKGNSRAYKVALKNGWLDEYTWFEDGRIKWTYETCMEESKKYMSRGEFQIGSKGAYLAAWKNGWIDEFFPKCNDLAMAAGW